MDFCQASENPVRKKAVYRISAIIKSSITKGYHEFHARQQKDLEMSAVVTSILFLTRVKL